MGTKISHTHHNYYYGSISFLQPLFLIFFLITTTLYINGIEASHEVHYNLQSVEVDNVSQLHRTGYHFQPKQNWINGTSPYCTCFILQRCYYPIPSNNN